MDLFRVIMVFYLVGFSVTTEEEALFSNSWAVEIRGGHVIADRLASKHGFVNRGQIGRLSDIYHFVHVFSPTRVRRRADELHSKHHHLKAEIEIGYVEQQVIKERHKRDHSYSYSAPASVQWKKQWYLHRSSGHNMNVERVWEQNIIGRGAVVTILDDGIEYTHPDLRANYDSLASYDFNDQDGDPFPRYDPTNENKHGTRCAGEVAAIKGGRCGAGVAFGAKIGGIRMLDGDVTDIVEASSLSLNPQHIQVYSSSWGPNDDGSTVDGPGKLAAKAFVDGVTNGRGGLGSIFVWAAGNGGRYGDSCNCDGYAVSPYTISVGAASERDDKPWYLEQCSSTLTSTYSSGSVGEKQIITTDLHNICTERHTGTSASAPLAAGMMALALEVNSNLTWRDMQYLMVYSSNPRYPHDDHWQINGAGLRVSHWYGFGIIDGAALVNRARNWVTVPRHSNCTFNATSNLKTGNVATGSSPLRVTIQVENCELVYLEHVQTITTININKGMRKDVSIHLSSPAKTESLLLPFRPHDRHRDGFHLWPFMTVHSWGEQPEGEWIFEVTVKHGSNVELSALELILYGVRSVPTAVQAIPSECDVQCLGKCARKGAQFCDVCKHYRLASTLECIEECPLGTYANENVCRSCPRLCARCSDEHSCIRCQHSAFQLPTGNCSDVCPKGTFTASNRTCVPCHSSCMSCNGPLNTSCTLCHPQFFLRDSACIMREPDSCPPGQYFDHRLHECRLCHKTCATCSGKDSTRCDSCRRGSQLRRNKCVSIRQLRNCDPGQYLDGISLECNECPSSCKNCSNTTTCTSCPEGRYLTWNGLCVESCPQHFVGDNATMSCLSLVTACHNSCLTCFGPGQIHCSSCPQGFLLLDNNSCVENCPSHYYNENDSTCGACHENCDSCIGPSEHHCLSCSVEKRFLFKRRCMEACPLGTFVRNDQCLPCTANCSSCLSPDSCDSCDGGYFLLQSKCLARCPAAYVSHPATRSCLPCPANCAVCYDTLSCHYCQPGYVYYAPNHSCEVVCPDGYYSSPTKNCLSCESPCNTCSTSPRNCSTCSTGMALDPLSRQCRECCNPDKSVTRCCDCDLDDKVCHWSNATEVQITAGTGSTVTLPSHVLSGILVLIALLFICLIVVIILVRYKYKNSHQTIKNYQKVPRHEDFNIFDESNSDSNLADA